jgi:hypothetical protein
MFENNDSNVNVGEDNNAVFQSCRSFIVKGMKTLTKRKQTIT